MNFIKKNITYVLIAAVILLIGGGFFAFQQITSNAQSSVSFEEVDLTFDAEGPYAMLYPRRDGNALILNLKRTASYEKITYELAYVSEAEDSTGEGIGEMIDRGVMGEINTKEKKGEYEQEILFGTCSKNVCKYDKGVENGTLTLHIQKGNQAYRMITQWRLQKPEIALGSLSSGDNHFSYKVDSKADLSLLKYTIINDLTGVAKLPNGKEIFGKAYTINTPQTKDLPKGSVKIELADNPPAGSKIARYDESNNKWVEYDTKTDGSFLSADVDGEGIIAVLSSKK